MDRRSLCAAGSCSTWRRWTASWKSSRAGIARCEPGARLGAIEVASRQVGWELRCYPSTYVKASVGGFLAGGSGGIGSMRHGGLRDPGTVASVDIITMEAAPRRLTLDGPDVLEVLHAYGTNGIIVECRLALAPKTAWAQLAAAFPTWDACYDFAEAVAYDEQYVKRLVTPFEWPIPSFFAPIKKLVREGCALAFFEIEDGQLDTLRAAAEGGGWRGDFRATIRRAAQGAAAFRLHLEPYHAMGHQERPGMDLPPGGLQTATTRAGSSGNSRRDFRPSFISTSSLRSGAAGSGARSDPAGAFHDRGTLAGNHRHLPRAGRDGFQSHTFTRWRTAAAACRTRCRPARNTATIRVGLLNPGKLRAFEEGM